MLLDMPKTSASATEQDDRAGVVEQLERDAVREREDLADVQRGLAGELLRPLAAQGEGRAGAPRDRLSGRSDQRVGRAGPGRQGARRAAGTLQASILARPTAMRWNATRAG
jgi:hypothetical protein